MIEKLTEQEALENKFSGLDCVRYYFNGISDEEADFILWEKTCFPFSTEMMLNQLYAIYLEKDGNKSGS
jgi:hypothetical protein